MREHGFEPLVDYPGADAPWLCRCMTCEQESTPTYSSVRAGSGCRHCGYERIAAASRLDPDAAASFMREHGLEPLAPYPGAGVGWLCECLTCGRQVSPRYNSIKQGQGGCGYCSGRFVAPEEAAQFMRANGFEPLTDYPGATQPWPCRCQTCDRDVVATYGGVRSGYGCSPMLGGPPRRNPASCPRNRSQLHA